MSTCETGLRNLLIRLLYSIYYSTERRRLLQAGYIHSINFFSRGWAKGTRKRGNALQSIQPLTRVSIPKASNLFLWIVWLDQVRATLRGFSSQRKKDG